LRVIAGVAKRIPLVAPEGAATRPTADRAKESLFNVISQRVRGARFLDIFCGSGAIGIEALSRGAKEAVFVESAKSALDAVKINLEKTKLADWQILKMSAKKAIKRLAEENRRFDIIFLDPPYDSPLLAQTIPELPQILAHDGLIIAETDLQLDAHDVRIYGRTKFLFWEFPV
jgi:16S rRNA (guanine(966)-N(2))-methyltransferase RsmD